MTHWNPLRRSALRPKPKQTKLSAPWRSPKVRLDAIGMRDLRILAYQRAAGQCENEVNGERCKQMIWWTSFHLAHLVSRGRGGSDCLENVLATCPECHLAEHRQGRKLRPYEGLFGAAPRTQCHLRN